MGNLLSVSRALEHCGADCFCISDAGKFEKAEKLLLPGVGAFAKAMGELRAKELIQPLHQAAAKGIPLLGICLGMQMLLSESEEFGLTPGLGLIPGRVVPIPPTAVSGEPLKTPHIGWSELASCSTSNWLESCPPGHRAHGAMYFVHSFMAVPTDPAVRLADCFYGDHRIPAVIKQKNVTGCQFHPEKSGKSGLAFLRRFLES